MIKIARVSSRPLVGPRVATYAIFLLALACAPMLLFFDEKLLSLGPAETVTRQTKTNTNATNQNQDQNQNQNQTASHELSPAIQLAMEFDKFSNLAAYTWEDSDDGGLIPSISHRYVPPLNFPHLTRRDMVTLFSKENTLWIGDSTARQDYQTFYWLLRETNQSESEAAVDLMDLSSLDFIEVGPQYKDILEKYRNVNKGGPDRLWCPARGIPREHWRYLVNVGLVGDDNDQKRCATTTTTTTTTTSPEPERIAPTGKLDYVTAKNRCLPRVKSEMIGHKSLLESYSVIVFSVGVVNSCGGCPGASQSQQVNDILDFLRQEIAGPERTVIWKLHAPGRVHFINTTADQQLVEATREWFENNRNATGMELADFRYAVHERTAEDPPSNRLWGDHPLHWGLNARLLCIDLVSRIIARARKK